MLVIKFHFNCGESDPYKNIVKFQNVKKFQHFLFALYPSNDDSEKNTYLAQKS